MSPLAQSLLESAANTRGVAYYFLVGVEVRLMDELIRAGLVERRASRCVATTAGRQALAAAQHTPVATSTPTQGVQGETALQAANAAALKVEDK